MKLNFTLDKEDYLLYQLFTTSKSSTIKRRRMRSRLMFPLIYLAFTFYFLSSYNYKGAIAFIGLAALWYFLYPLWEKGYYYRHYEGFIQEFQKERYGLEGSLDFGKDSIIAKEQNVESVISMNELESIQEIDRAIYIQLRQGHSFILPKSKLENLDLVTRMLEELAERLKIPYVKDENWKWK